MKKLKVDLITGTIILDELGLDVTDEDTFCESNFYKSMNSKGSIKKIIPHHYLIESIIFFNKEFEMHIRPICFNFPFMVQLIDKKSKYYDSLSDWDKRTNIKMLNESVENLSNWLGSSLELREPDFISNEVVRWEFFWGDISVSYETRSFNHGIYITWNTGE
ncbi:hypothetical protein C7434_4342 [Pantoea sp. PNA 14-12]|uniref:hypothetical protein n=1 Tax=Pantoea TaxID=53335 RepID=UPI0005102863|nr:MULTISPECIES: hypothetical protein [Pantoea]KGD81420.1 hypothetical protein HA47_21180 [Pantoea stewartii subsp. indologenes]TDS65162.1 hypothetical protein C7434_4342 [Pantoea sp. PNA 14-12]